MSPKVLYTGIAVVLAVIIIALFFFFPNYLGGMGLSGQAQNPNTSQSVTSSGQPAVQAGQPTQNSLMIQDVKIGSGREATSGSEVEVSYVGKLQDGTIFDQSSAHGGTFTFVLGAGQVIPGWDQGIVGMKVGGERTLTIPPSLAYGAQQVGPIPPNSTLIFDVTLINVKPVSSSTPYIPTGAATE